MNNIKLFAKNEKRIEDSDRNNKNMQPGYRNGIWHKKCAMLIMKIGKRQKTEGIKLSNQEIAIIITITGEQMWGKP